MVDVNDFLSNIKMFKVNYDDKEFIENFEKQTNIKKTSRLLIVFYIIIDLTITFMASNLFEILLLLNLESTTEFVLAI